MVLLQTTVMLFAQEAELNPGATPEEKAIAVYKHTIMIEFFSVVVALVFALIFGYLYEVWSRQAVLVLSFVLLGISMV